MNRCLVAMSIIALASTGALAQDSKANVTKTPVHLWFEPEWFEGVNGSFAYWTGEAKATGAWGVAGPGIAAEWSQGGESEWNSMGAAASETKAECGRDFRVPRAGAYRLWVRYVDHRQKTEPFRVIVESGGKAAVNHEFGTKPAVSEGDEYQLYWGFSFAWASADVTLAEGPAKLRVIIDRAAEAWRQVDAILLTEDKEFTPEGREKPTFAYQQAFGVRGKNGEAVRGSGKSLPSPAFARPQRAGADFTMWTGVEPDPKWWGKQNLDVLKLPDVFFQFSPPSEIRDKFHKQFKGAGDAPLMTWPGLRPGLYLGANPDLSADAPVRKWLEKTKTPFFIMTNYASPKYDDKTGPGTYAALAGPLAPQFLGYIHGEAVGTSGMSIANKPLGPDRRKHIDALFGQWREQQAKAWSGFYKTNVPADHWNKGIACLSTDSTALAHGYHESGASTVGYEIDATNVHAPMRIAFERGAARQYGGAWINYASGNFGDSCNYFTQNPVVPRGAPSWFHSRYAITDGVSIAWYRKLYYLNFLGGASAIYWEQNLTNQYILPGPGTHPIQLSPYGRATQDFQKFVDRLPDRGEPITPVAILLSHGNSYDRVNYMCKMLHVFREDDNDRELRELFNVCWHPTGINEGKPASPDVQSMPAGTFGDVFDVLVDRAKKADAIRNYPVVWAAGDVDLSGPWRATLEKYLRDGGTLVVNIQHAKDLPAEWLGVAPTPQKIRSETWSVNGKTWRPATPFEVAKVERKSASVLAWADKDTPLITRNAVGEGAVILTLAPRMLGIDERAHPALPYLMNELVADLLPVDVRLANGKRPEGEVHYSVNRTKDGFLVSLYNHCGIDKTQNGIARVDRRAFVDVVLNVRRPVRSACEWTEPRELPLQDGNAGREVHLRIMPGDVKVVGFVAGR